MTTRPGVEPMLMNQTVFPPLNCILEPNGDEIHCPTETKDNEAGYDLFSLCLGFLLVVEATEGTEEGARGPEASDARGKFTQVEAA